MALFKILKGSNRDLFTTPTGQEKNLDHPSKKTVQGYCYFTPDNGKFYIDVADSNEVTLGTNRICLNAEEADKLRTARSINGVSFNGTTDITNYAVCPTAANEPIKNVDLTNFNLVENKPVKGARLLIKFTNMNSASDPKLSINNDTKDDHARPLMLTSSDPMGTDFKTNGWPDGAVIPFTYDGT